MIGSILIFLCGLVVGALLVVLISIIATAGVCDETDFETGDDAPRDFDTAVVDFGEMQKRWQL